MTHYPEAQRRYHQSAKGRASRKLMQAEKVQRFKRILASIKLTAGCLDCGYAADARALQFDHVRGEKRYNVVQARTWATLWPEIDKCDVRCANCHAIRTHQTELARVAV